MSPGFRRRSVGDVRAKMCGPDPDAYFSYRGYIGTAQLSGVFDNLESREHFLYRSFDATCGSDQLRPGCVVKGF